jgi:hypothetical protein
VYACEIKETANGCRRGARGKTRKALEVIVERCIAQDGKLNESKPVAEASEDETEKIAEEKAPLGRQRHAYCIAAIACLKGSKLTLLVPVKG